MLATPNCDLTIEAVAIDSGFGSRNTFYRLFRERFGLTPVEFRNFACEKKND
jgi:transcriptional regulator GlxA family with amidase domain